MIKHVWSVLASKSVVDNETDLISIHDIADTLNIEAKKSELMPDGAKRPEMLNVPVQSEMVSMFYRTTDDDEKAQIKIELTDPTDKKLSEFGQEIELTKPFLRTRIKITGLSINKSGVYKMRVYLKGKSDEDFQPVAEIPFVVNLSIK